MTEQDSMSTSTSTSTSASTAAAPPTILCVDDEPNILSSLRRLFRPHGYRVLTADGGAAGLALLESETVDLVISDMRMPHMDGAQFLAQVRQRWPGTMRLLLTGYADIQSILDGICPKLIPLGLTMMLYALMTKKRWTPIKCIGLLLAIGLVGGLIGIW